MNVPLLDLHVHTLHSDGEYSAEEIVARAVQNGVKILAVTDHYRTNKTHSIQSDELPDYLKNLEDLKQRYSDRLRLLKGLEIDLADLARTARPLPDPQYLTELDFLLFEYVDDSILAGVPISFAQKLRKTVPLPVIIAHTDIERAFPRRSIDELITRFSTNQLFLELNESYSRPGEAAPYYEHFDEFYKKARGSGIWFTAGSDTHDSMEGLGARRAIDFLISKGLESQIWLPAERPAKF